MVRGRLSVKEIMLEALTNVLKRKRQEWLAEELKVEEILKATHFPKKERPPKDYLDNLNALKSDVRKLEDVIDVVRREV